MTAEELRSATLPAHILEVRWEKCAIHRRGGQSGLGVLELTTVVAIAVLAGSALLSGFVGATKGVERLAAVAVLREAITDARRTAYARAESVTLRSNERGFVVETAQPSASKSFELPRGVIVEGSTRSGRIRFFADGLSDNASITLRDTENSWRSTVFIDSRGELR